MLQQTQACKYLGIWLAFSGSHVIPLMLFDEPPYSFPPNGGTVVQLHLRSAGVPFLPAHLSSFVLFIPACQRVGNGISLWVCLCLLRIN